MKRSDFGTPQEFAQYIARLEKHYTERLFHALYRNAGNIRAWYNEPNKVPETWRWREIRFQEHGFEVTR